MTLYLCTAGTKAYEASTVLLLRQSDHSQFMHGSGSVGLRIAMQEVQ